MTRDGFVFFPSYLPSSLKSNILTYPFEQQRPSQIRHKSDKRDVLTLNVIAIQVFKTTSWQPARWRSG